MSSRTGLTGVEAELLAAVAGHRHPVRTSVVLAWVTSTWPVSRTERARLPAPLAELITTWDAGDGTGLSALADLLASAP